MEERRPFGSNAETAAGGLNPEDAYAALDETTASRMTSETYTDIAAHVKRHLQEAPGGIGAAYNRGEHADP